MWVFILEPDAVLQRQLLEIIRAVPGVSAAGDAEMEHFLAGCRAYNPGLVIMSWDACRQEGLDLIQRETLPETQRWVCTAHALFTVEQGVRGADLVLPRRYITAGVMRELVRRAVQIWQASQPQGAAIS